MSSKDGKKEHKIVRLINGGKVGTSYTFARLADCTPSYAFKVLESMVKRGLVHKIVHDGKYIYSRGL